MLRLFSRWVRFSRSRGAGHQGDVRAGKENAPQLKQQPHPTKLHQPEFTVRRSCRSNKANALDAAFRLKAFFPPSFRASNHYQTTGDSCKCSLLLLRMRAELFSSSLMFLMLSFRRQRRVDRRWRASVSRRCSQSRDAAVSECSLMLHLAFFYSFILRLITFFLLFFLTLSSAEVTPGRSPCLTWVRHPNFISASPGTNGGTCFCHVYFLSLLSRRGSAHTVNKDTANVIFFLHQISRFRGTESATLGGHYHTSVVVKAEARHTARFWMV